MKNKLMSAAVVLACVSALADIKVFIAQQHFFHEPTAWSPTGVPTAQDRIVIPANSTCYVVLDATVDTVDVQAGGLLIVHGESAGTKLTHESTQNLATG